MIQILEFGLGQQSKFDKIFCPMNFTNTCKSSAIDAIVKSGLPELVEPIVDNYWQQTYQVVKSGEECQTYFLSNLPSSEYPLGQVIILFLDSTEHRSAGYVSHGWRPFSITPEYGHVMKLLEKAGYVNSVHENKFRWTDKMAKIFNENGDWGAPTVAGWGKSLRQSNLDLLERLITHGLVQRIEGGNCVWTDKSRFPGEVFNEHDWLDDVPE